MREGRVVVEQEGGPVESHRRLPRSRTPLDRQQLVERGPDDLVLLGLDCGHNVEHFPGPRTFELGQQCIATAQAGSRQLAPRLAEKVVGDGDHLTPIDHHLTAELQTEGFPDPGPVERHGDPRAPIDHDRIPEVVFDMAPPDVPGRSVSFIDTPEEERPNALAQHRHPVHQSSLVVEVGLAGSTEVIEEGLRPSSHGREPTVRAVQILLLALQLGILDRRGIGHERPVAHRGAERNCLLSPKRVCRNAQKPPVISGEYT